MKTNTRFKIIEIIENQGNIRPVELVKKLGITPQAIHRHLRALTESGCIERLGRGPLTRYRIAGMPRLDAARAWCASMVEPESPRDLVSATRDVFMARLGRLGSWTRAGLVESDLPLVISAAGEVGNNCFDHNLGKWRDVPGCWFEIQATGGLLWICIADRGQGVFRSLARVAPDIEDEQAALRIAFEKTLSGRSPENRGNGLKFVRAVAAASDGRGLACRSGSGLIHYGRLGPDCRIQMERFSPRPGGTVTLILWSLR